MRLLLSLLLFTLFTLLGVIVILYRPYIPHLSISIDGGLLVPGLLGFLLSVFLISFLLIRFLKNRRRNILASVWAFSFFGIAFYHFGLILKGLGLCGMEQVCACLLFMLGENFWATGMLAGAIYIFSPERSPRWILLPILYFISSVGVSLLLAVCATEAETILIVNGFFFITPAFALVAHSFIFYLKVRKTVFAPLLTAGLGIAIASSVTRGVLMSSPLIHFVNALTPISLAFMLAGFIFMRFETGLKEEEWTERVSRFAQR